MSDKTFTQSLTEGLADQAKRLAHLRRVPLTEAWAAVSATCQENIEWSVGDTDAIAYWRSALAVCERQRTDESDPRWKL